LGIKKALDNQSFLLVRAIIPSESKSFFTHMD
jgi:hypothetical protein